MAIFDCWRTVAVLFVIFSSFRLVAGADDPSSPTSVSSSSSVSESMVNATLASIDNFTTPNATAESTLVSSNNSQPTPASFDESTLANSTIENSTVTVENSTIENSTANSTAIENSTATSTAGANSTESTSIGNSTTTANSSSLENSTVTENSTSIATENSTIAENSTIVENSTAVNSTSPEANSTWLSTSSENPLVAELNASTSSPWLNSTLESTSFEPNASISIFNITSTQTPENSSIAELETSTLAIDNFTSPAESNSTSNATLASSSIEPNSTASNFSATSVPESTQSGAQSIAALNETTFAIANSTTAPESNVTLLANSTAGPESNSTLIANSTAAQESNSTLATQQPSENSSTVELQTSTLNESTVSIDLNSSTIAIESNATESSSSSAPGSTPISNFTQAPIPGGRPPRVSDFDCLGLDPGYYGNPNESCSRIFFICVDQSLFAYEQQCPAKLYYDSELEMCNMWAHIPACSGRPRPPVEVSNQTEATLSPVPLVIDCYNLTDGNYPDPISTPKAYCSNRFFTCVGHREFAFFCPPGLFYDHERNQCDTRERVFVCSGNRVLNDTEITWAPPAPPVQFDCHGKPDGYYVEQCDSVYYNCNGGTASEFHCPDGLVFDSEWLACEAPFDTFICTGSRKPSTTRPPSTPSHQSNETTTPSPLSCHGRPDGIYRDPRAKCSRTFYYCAHEVTYSNLCPGNLYYDDEMKRCDLWINVFDCSGNRPTTTSVHSTTPPEAFPTVDFDCLMSEDGNFANPKNNCSQFYYVCANMEAFQQYCPASLYYNPDLNNCDAWSNIFACTGVTPKPTPATLPETRGTTRKPEFDCSLKSDGVYSNAVNACSNAFFRCVAGNSFKFLCPDGLYYDATVDQCDVFDNVHACSGHSRPSTAQWNSTSHGSTSKPPIDCRSLPDGDYADPSAQNHCSHYFYTCSSGFAVQRECADGTYFDPELRSCDQRWNVPICSGKSRPTTVKAPSTLRTTGPPLAFDCTKLYDGNYPAGNCSGDFWSCVGGTTFQRRCPIGFIYDDELDACEFPHMVPSCGGKRLTSPSSIKTSTGTPVGGFVCIFRVDGNYVDPEAADGCSTIYYVCANGMTTRVHCPAGLYYDHIDNLCNSHDKVPACFGSNFTRPSPPFVSNVTSPSATASTSNATAVSTPEFQNASQTEQPIFNTSSAVQNVSTSAIANATSTSVFNFSEPSTNTSQVNITEITEAQTNGTVSPTGAEFQNFTESNVTVIPTGAEFQNFTESNVTGIPTGAELQNFTGSTELQSNVTAESNITVEPQSNVTAQANITVEPQSNVTAESNITVEPQSNVTAQANITVEPQSNVTAQANITVEPQSNVTAQANITVEPQSNVTESIEPQSNVTGVPTISELENTTFNSNSSQLVQNVTEPIELSTNTTSEQSPTAANLQNSTVNANSSGPIENITESIFNSSSTAQPTPTIAQLENQTLINETTSSSPSPQNGSTVIENSTAVIENGTLSSEILNSTVNVTSVDLLINATAITVNATDVILINATASVITVNSTNISSNETVLPTGAGLETNATATESSLAIETVSNGLGSQNSTLEATSPSILSTAEITHF